MSEPTNATATQSRTLFDRQDWSRKRQQIDAALDAYSRLDGDCPTVLRDAIRHSLLAPGKRLRPLLLLLAIDACGVDWQIGIPAGCAIEMVHTYSLIHDDLPAMDDDDLRRGLPTCHKLFGEAIAILAGDALLALAFELLGRELKDPEQIAACLRELARAAGPTALVGGQVDDLAAEFQSGDLPWLQHIHRRKTGALLVAALRMGGVIGRASPEQMAALATYGQKLGLAFQIVDDLLDTQGNDSDLGKRAGKDQRRGKLTFPGLLGLESSVRCAATLVDEAIEATKEFGERANALQELARYVLERKH
jgi:geranylgeranyl diphosphate synthase type II